MMRPPPIRIDVAQRTILGFNTRQIAILALAGFTALTAFAGLTAAPLFLRGALAVLAMGLGVALAFGEVGGKTPEAWLWEWLAFGRRPRYLLHRAVRAKGERHVVLPDASAAKETQEEKAMPEQTARPVINFFVLSANAIALSLVVGLTLYLLDGGAERLMRLWWRM